MTRRPQVTVLTGLPDAAYSPFGIPYFHRGEISGFDRLVLQTKDHYREQGLDIHYETHVESVDLAKGEVAVRGSGRLPFDRLVVGTGFSYETPDIPGTDLEGIYYVRDLRLAREWDERLESVKTAVVVEPSRIGVEIATALARRGIETYLVDPHPWPMAEIADPDIMAPVEESWRDLGVNCTPTPRSRHCPGPGRSRRCRPPRGSSRPTWW